MCVANAQNAAKFVAYYAACFGKGMSGNRFYAQSCWIALLRYMALNSVTHL
jgi:hypothetical protein